MTSHLYSRVVLDEIVVKDFIDSYYTENKDSSYNNIDRVINYIRDNYGLQHVPNMISKCPFTFDIVNTKKFLFIGIKYSEYISYVFTV